MTKEQLKELDEYLLSQVGKKSSELIGYYSVLKEDIEAKMLITPEHHYTYSYPVKIKKGTELKILAFSIGAVYSLGDSNILVIEILQPQIETEIGKLEVKMKTLVEAMENTLTEEDMHELNNSMQTKIHLGGVICDAD